MVPAPDGITLATAGTHVPSASQTHAVGPCWIVTFGLEYVVWQVVPGIMTRFSPIASIYAERYSVAARSEGA
jgi:hypothetical protein